jgi:hypothetical protein
VLALVACKPVVKPPLKPLAGAVEPQIAATVMTIQTIVQPGNKTTIHALVIANGRARSGDDLDHWRLFDFEHEQVTFVDDIARTYYIQPVEQLLALRTTAIRAPSTDDIPRAQFTSTGAKRIIQGTEAAQSIIRLGGYQRELWIGAPRDVPPELYAVLHATDPLDERYAPMMRVVEEALLSVRGFPLADHAELPYGKTRLVVDRLVTKIEQRKVPQSFLNVSGKYREVTAPGANPPPVSSPLPSRNTRAAGLRFFERVRRTP